MSDRLDAMVSRNPVKWALTQINRLKTLKRQMYGRAGTDLLANRFLLAD